MLNTQWDELIEDVRKLQATQCTWMEKFLALCERGSITSPVCDEPLEDHGGVYTRHISFCDSCREFAIVAVRLHTWKIGGP